MKVLQEPCGTDGLEGGTSSLSEILCVRHSMSMRSMYADEQDENEERSDSRPNGGVAHDPQ
ncbi:hypothetical protein, partial [Xylophilus sp.]|uniref:hypothetical protein n=1 Tax=Xylophilus sp. TaxID=2653893 RepID=UPI002D7E7EF6